MAALNVYHNCISFRQGSGIESFLMHPSEGSCSNAKFTIRRYRLSPCYSCTPPPPQKNRYLGRLYLQSSGHCSLCKCKLPLLSNMAAGLIGCVSLLLHGFLSVFASRAHPTTALSISSVSNFSSFRCFVSPPFVSLPEPLSCRLQRDLVLNSPVAAFSPKTRQNAYLMLRVSTAVVHTPPSSLPLACRMASRPYCQID